jgi:hypothetical protein
LAVKECVYDRIPAARRASVQDVLSQPKSSWRTKRGLLVKVNVPKGTLDELEALSEAGKFITIISDNFLIISIPRGPRAVNGEC